MTLGLCLIDLYVLQAKPVTRLVFVSLDFSLPAISDRSFAFIKPKPVKSPKVGSENNMFGSKFVSLENDRILSAGLQPITKNLESHDSKIWGESLPKATTKSLHTYQLKWRTNIIIFFLYLKSDFNLIF